MFAKHVSCTKPQSGKAKEENVPEGGVRKDWEVSRLI